MVSTASSAFLQQLILTDSLTGFLQQLILTDSLTGHRSPRRQPFKLIRGEAPDWGLQSFRGQGPGQNKKEEERRAPTFTPLFPDRGCSVTRGLP